MLENIYKGKRVLITGHTGFKGSWLCAWLLDLGARVAGYSVDVPTKPSHFEILDLASRIEHFKGDIRNKNIIETITKDTMANTNVISYFTKKRKKIATSSVSTDVRLVL